MSGPIIKVITKGREQRFPLLKLLGLLAFMWGWGFLSGALYIIRNYLGWPGH